jgi:uncharacterized spore protein YtfJ
VLHLGPRGSAVELHLERRMRAAPRVQGPDGMSVVPVHSVLHARVVLPRRAEAGAVFLAPLGVLAEQGEERCWHGVPLIARGLGGIVIGVVTGSAYRMRHGPAIGDIEEGDEMAEEVAPTSTTSTTGTTGSHEDEPAQGDAARMFASIEQSTGAEIIAGAMAGLTRSEAAVGPATSTASHTVVPLTETIFYGGFGMGLGSGTGRGGENQSMTGSGGGGGAGGGGGGHSRTIAVVVMGPDGVKIRPVVDPTKIALAAVGAWASVMIALMRRRK